MMKTTLPAFFLFLSLAVQAQYLETFATANKGYLINMQDDFTGVGWTLSNWNKQPPNAVGRDSFDYFQTTAAGVLESIDIDNEVCWESPLINISAAGTVSLSTALVWIGFDNDVAANSCVTASDVLTLDYIKVLYSVNGGGYTMIPNQIGGASCATIGYASGAGTGLSGSTTVTQGGISGNSLKIRVCVGTNANAEIVQIDNISVPQAGVTTGCSAPSVSTTTTQAGSCNNANGSITVTANGATPGYNVAWSGPTSGNPGGTEIASAGGSYTITPLGPGTYTITVTDAASCSVTTTAGVTTAATLSLSTQVLNTSCSGSADGEINLGVSNGVPPYTYSWSNLPGSPDPQDQTDLIAGTYTVTVTDNAGCTAVTSGTVGVASSGPYLETFSTPNRGYLTNFVDDFAGVNWSMSNWDNQPPAAFGRDNNDYFRTTAGGLLEAFDLDQEVCWLSPILNIASSGSVTFNVPVTWNQFDNEDYVNVSYSLNGAAFVTIPNAVGGGAGTIQYPFPTTDQSGSTTITQTGLTGSTLQIRACASSNSDAETVQFDNIGVPQNVSLCLCPSITFTATPTATCSGSSNGQIAVTGVTGGTGPYMYSKDNGANYQSGATFTGLAANTYQVVVKDANNCTSTATAVTVNSLVTPTCSIGGSSTACSNSTGNVYSATAGMSAYSWGISGSGSIIGSTTGSSVTVTAGASGAYTVSVTITAANGCTSTCSQLVTTIGLPDCTITGPSSVCAGSTGNVYSATAGMSAYSWGISGSGSIIGSTTGSSVTVTAGASGAYTVSVTITAANGCTSTCSQLVTTIGLPDCTITGPPPFPGPSNDTLCIGHEYVFSTIGGMSAYKWGTTANATINGSSTGSSVSITVNSGFSLLVRDTVTDANGCKSACFYNRPVQASPTCSVGGPATVCGGSTGNVYTVTTNGQFYSWSISGNGTIVGSTTGTSVSVTAGASGTYTVTVAIQFSFNTCGSSCSQTVTINNASTPTITGPTSVCSGGSVMLDAGPGYSAYAWSGGGGSSQTATYNNITAPMTYTVTVTSGGCTGTDSHTVTVNPLPSCSINGADFVCSNSTGNVYSAPGGMSSYSWGISGNGTITSATNGSSVTVTAGNYLGTYTVTVTITDGNGCTSSCSKVSNIFLLTPPANITVNPNPACFGATLDLSITAAASSTVSWSGEGIGNASGNPSTTALPTTTGPHTYSVIVTTDQGCSNTGTASVTINSLPTVTCPGNSGPICSNAPAYALTGGSPGGGVYSGPGVSAGMFNPAAAGAGTHTIAYTVTDGNNCLASCTFTITVNICTIDFSGKIIWENDDVTGVKNATVNLTGSATGSALTDINGNFMIATPLTSGSFTLKPVKNLNKFNGVTAADATAIQQHVANIVIITDPYKLVCADVNKSNSITTVDASLITQALANNPQANAIFNTSWRFVPTSHTMANPPWYFPEQRTYVNVSGPQTNQDFYGMKIGDVVATYANPANFGPSHEASGLMLRAADQVLQAGQTVEVAFSADRLDDLAAFQFALAFDPAQLHFEAVEPETALPISTGNFGTYDAADGEIRAVWAQATGLRVEEAAPVFRLRFTALTSGANLSDVLHLDADALGLPPLAYTSKLAESSVELQYSVSTGTEPDLSGPALTLESQPNPFVEVTTLRFLLPKAGEAELRISDVAGRLVFSQKKTYPAGWQQETMRLEGVSGVLFAELVTERGSVVRKMLAVKN